MDPNVLEISARRRGRLDPTRAGRCYELAGQRMIRNGDRDLLVHGTIQGGGNDPIGHAWVILHDGTVWEPFGDDLWSNEDFYRLFRAVNRDAYTWKEMAACMLATTHFGPWAERFEE